MIMKISVLEITNISNQLITFGYSTIHSNSSVTNVNPMLDGIMKLISGSSISIEESRIDISEIESIAKKKLISLKRRFIDAQPIPQPPCFEIQDVTQFVGFPITITPMNVTGTVSYWSVQGLPSGWTFNQASGVITAPSQVTASTIPIVVSAISPDNLICSVNHTIRIEDPDIIDITWDSSFGPFVLPIDTSVITSFAGLIIGGPATVLNFYVDWGDGNVEYFNSIPDSRTTHTYAAVGSYNIRILGELDVIDGFAKSVELFSFFQYGGVVSWNEINSKSIRRFNFSGFFGGSSALLPTSINLPNLEDASRMFFGNLNFDETMISTGFLGPRNNVRFAVNAFGNSGVSGPYDPAWWAIYPNAENLSGLVAGCFGITGSIPANIFSLVPSSCINLDYSFNGHFSVTPVPFPSGVFDPVPQLESAEQIFGVNSATTLPANMFTNNPNLRVFSFGQCNTLVGPITPGLLDNAPALEDVDNLFLNCQLLSGTIPATLFANCPLLKTASGAFYRCLSITGTPPAALFANNGLLENLDRAFEQMTNFVYAIPAGFFDSNSALISAYRCFEHGISGGTLGGSLPAGLLDNCVSLSNVREMFSNQFMSGPIPNGLFANCPLVNAAGAFGFWRHSAAIIPGDLFGNQPDLVDLNGFFQNANPPVVTTFAPGLLDQCPNVVNMQRALGPNTNGPVMSFPTGFFDNLTLVNNYSDVFTNGVVSATNIDAWLISVDTNNVATGVRQFKYNSIYGTGHLDVNRSPAALTAKNNLITKGWILTGIY